MRQIKFDPKPFNGVTTLMTMTRIWENNFIHETSKFISATHMSCDDLGKDFTDESGEKWKILGMMDGREMPCQKLSTEEIFVWDRWKVSQLLHPERHEKATRKVDYVLPSKQKTRKTRKSQEGSVQLDLFGSPVPAFVPLVEIVSAKYGADERVVDVTEKVKSLYTAGTKVKANNSLGGDPAPGVPKILTVSYIQDGNTLTTTFPEKTPMVFR